MREYDGGRRECELNDFGWVDLTATTVLIQPSEIFPTRQAITIFRNPAIGN